MAVLAKGVWCPSQDETDLHAAGLTDEGVHHTISKDGSPGSSDKGGFTPEKDRYHLYASWACPFASRALLYRSLFGLQETIGLSIVAPTRGADGWHFETASPYVDNVFGKQFLRDIYVNEDSTYSGRVTVPVLWDKKKNAMVSNDSGEIMRMLDVAFNDTPVFLQEDRMQEIDTLNATMQANVNFGVYRCGFAEDQATYDEAFTTLFRSLDELEDRLSSQQYLLGGQLTECDWRLFTTLVRFDAVYYVHFKTNLRRISDYPNLSDYTRELYQIPGVAETVDMEHVKTHYYSTHDFLNPRGIIPGGPIFDFDLPHDRGRFG
jgi:putative glutathione S-transferase